jgi:hypothetical protein
MFVHIPDNKTVVLGRIGVIRIELIVRNGCPRHASLAGTIDDARMNLTEDFACMVVEACRHPDASCPELNMADLLQRVGLQLDLEPD